MKRMTISLMIAALAISGCFEQQGTVVEQDSSGNGGYSVTEPEVQEPPAEEPPVEQPQVPEEPQDPNDEEPPQVGIHIKGDPRFVSDPHVTAEIQYGGWPMMKLGFADDCSDGQWEAPVATRDLTLTKLNAVNTVSVQFSDADLFIRSACYKAQVTHDDQGPTIIFKSYPAPSIEEGVATQIQYEVTDVSGVRSVVCDFLDQQKACPAGGPIKVDITPLPAGDYEFRLSAEDVVGNSSSASVTWKVVSTTKHLVQKLSLNDYRKVDILMVIDNSGSMEYEQRNMAERTSNLLSILRGLDWQIGVTTTDARNVTRGDGRLLALNGLSKQYVLNSSMNEGAAQTVLSNTLQRPETGSGLEQGIRTTYRALERSLDAKDPASSLIRPGAHFATVVISDEDESANGEKNDPHNLIKFIADTFGQKNFSFNSIITVPGDKKCRSTYGATYGDRYKMLSDLTGGVIGSVCASDYAQQVAGVAEEIRNLLKMITLQCEPIQTMPLTITVNGSPLGLPYRVEGVNLKFDTELPPGDYVVDYHCLK